MASRPRPLDGRRARRDTASRSARTSVELDLVRQVMRQTSRDLGDGGQRVSDDGRPSEADSGLSSAGAAGDGRESGDVPLPYLHCPRCRLATRGERRRFSRSGCPRCGAPLADRPARLFDSPLPSYVAAAVARRRDGSAAGRTAAAGDSARERSRFPGRAGTGPA